MNSKEIQEFVIRRQEDYEECMITYWDEAKTLEELTGYHRQVKSDLILGLKEKWKLEMTGPEIPADLRDLLPRKIDETFMQLKQHFTGAPKAEPQQDIPSTPKPKQIRKVSTNQHQPVAQEYALGIDLGTTMCCVAVMNNGSIEIVQNRSQDNARITPSYISFREDGTDTFGHLAKDQAYKHPEITIYDAKRIIGRTWDDAILQKDKLLWPFEVVNQNGNAKVKTGSRYRYPHEISARLLSRFRAMAEEFLYLHKGTIQKAVITVPAYFSEPQRRATRDAAMIAGLEVLNILSEPTAAAIAYSWERKLQGTRNVLIYDLGGGTFDVSIAVVKEYQVDVLCVHGDTHLGGQDFDQLLLDHCIKEFKRTTNIYLLAGRNSQDANKKHVALRALGRLRMQCEKAKKILSQIQSTSVEVDCIMNDTDLSIPVTRELLNKLCKPLVQKTIEIVDKAFVDAASKGIKGKHSIDDVIMVGGSTRMPLVEEMVQQYFGGKMLCKSINPDEAVAYGAAVQANILSRPGNRKSQHVLDIQDVTPLNLGIECSDDKFSIVIAKNTKIPCQVEKIYSTSVDGQTTIKITVCQGDSIKASENIKLGEFTFSGIPRGPAKQEKLAVTMEIDAMGILHVKAVSESTSKKAAITISSTQPGMTEREVDVLNKEMAAL